MSKILVKAFCIQYFCIHISSDNLKVGLSDFPTLCVMLPVLFLQTRELLFLSLERGTTTSGFGEWIRLGVVRSPTIYLGRIPEENLLLLLLRRNVVGQIEALLLIHPGGSSGRA